MFSHNTFEKSSVSTRGKEWGNSGFWSGQELAILRRRSNGLSLKCSEKDLIELSELRSHW